MSGVRSSSTSDFTGQAAITFTDDELTLIERMLRHAWNDWPSSMRRDEHEVAKSAMLKAQREMDRRYPTPR